EVTPRCRADAPGAAKRGLEDLSRVVCVMRQKAQGSVAAAAVGPGHGAIETFHPKAHGIPPAAMTAQVPPPVCSGARTKTVASVVTCNPDSERFPALLTVMQGQVDRLIVVDNDSRYGRDALERCEGMAQAELMRMHENLGIGAAHNAGIRTAKELGATH